MNTRALLKLLLVVLVVCFLLGLLSVFLRSSEQAQGGVARTPALPGFSRPPTAIPQGQQTTILILGVDRLQASDRVLRAVWFATFRAPGKDVFFYGLPTDRQVGGEATLTLASLFAWSPDRGVDPIFMAKLKTALPLEPHATIVMDEAAFAALVDYLGGVDLSGNAFSGTQVQGILDLVHDQPQAALTTQARLIEALAQKLPALGAAPDVTRLQALIPEHAVVSIPLTQLVAALSPLFPAAPTAVFVNPLSSRP